MGSEHIVRKQYQDAAPSIPHESDFELYENLSTCMISQYIEAPTPSFEYLESLLLDITTEDIVCIIHTFIR